MIKKEINLETSFDSYTLVKITKGNIPELQEILEISSDFFLLAEKRTPELHEAKDILEIVPEGKMIDDKFDYGIYERNTLIGIVDIIRDYPEEDTWFIGLLLILPYARGKGLGEKVYIHIREKLKNGGVKKIRISVVTQNIKAVDFWKSLGFVETNREVKESNTLIYFDHIL